MENTKEINLDRILKYHTDDVTTLHRENLNMAVKLHIEQQEKRILKAMVENLSNVIEKLIIKQNQSVDIRDDLVNTVQVVTNALTAPEIFEKTDIKNKINVIPDYKVIEIRLKDFLHNSVADINEIIEKYDKFVLTK